MKKNAFASACLFGENNNSSISGIQGADDKLGQFLDQDIEALAYH
jgi:hypothetical protein